MTRLVTLIVTAGILAGCSAAGPADRAERKTDLRVMTFNIRYGAAKDGENDWQHRREMVFQVLRDHRPDVVGLQEALRFQIDEMLAAAPGYGEIAVGRDDGKNAGEASAILYRTDRLEIDEQGTFWLSDTPEVAGSKHWGNAITRLCTWARLRDKQTKAHFYMYNTHLDHQSQPARERGAELIVQRINQRSHRDPIILTGDLNADERNPAVRYLKREIPAVPARPENSAAVPPLADTFRVLHPDAKPAGTFNGFTGKKDGGKIDYILTSPEWCVMEAAIVYDNKDGHYPSDHFPVTAVLKLKP
ncbi:MAG: endonuclease/exonuclease/phosphatase family protein [Phycisphaerae bacterium]|nr:endonuclease/exonuclease/phosphatase family protein [Phycisphaerae bacterium]